jgi:hypothetical protein
VVVLALPAVEGAAVVLEAEGDATHSTGSQQNPGGWIVPRGFRA